MASQESISHESISVESSIVTVSRRAPAASVGTEAGRTVVWLRGEQDVTTVAALSQALARGIALDDADLVVDLSEVRFMDAATIGVIIRARNVLRLRSRSLALRSAWGLTRRVLDLCGLVDLIDLRSADPSPTAGAAGAPGSRLTLQTTGRVDRRAEASAPTSSRAVDPVRAADGTPASSASPGRAHGLRYEVGRGGL